MEGTNASVCRRAVLIAALACACAVPASAPAARLQAPTLVFKLFVATNLPVGQVLWTGRHFVYVRERDGSLSVSDPDGSNLGPLASFEIRGQEMRCVQSPGAPWLPGVYCHTPDNRIVRVSPDGSDVSVVAKLPASATPSDGGIAYDTVGRFGHRLLVSSGRSSGDLAGGRIYTVGRNGKVALVGAYPGPGGADNIAVGPRRFGRAAGSVLITTDYQTESGRVLAMDDHGTVSVLASGLGNGLNPIQPITAPRGAARPSSAAAGLYFADDLSGNVYFAPGAPLEPYAGDVIVGTELHAWFWVLRPTRTGGYEALRVRTNLPSQKWSIEGAAFVP